MKELATLLLISAVTFSAIAQGKLDPGSRARLRQLQSPVKVELNAAGKPHSISNQRRSKADTQQTLVRAFITLTPGADTSALEALGAEVRTTRAGMVLAQFPLSALAEIEALECVKAIRTEQTVDLRMNLVRPLVGIDKIHSGTELPQAYTGKGVICGIVDGGFDPNHINFLDADGKQRISQFTYFRGVQNSSQLAEERVVGDEILEIDTENAESFHATHTTGIMAGSYRGKIQVPNRKSYYDVSLEEVDNPFYGIAYESEICTASAYQGQLSDVYIAYGIESMLDYAYFAGKPLSVNLSLGSNVGAHDGTSVICQYLDQVCDNTDVNTIVSISAGNEGDMPICLNKRFAGEDLTLSTGLFAMYDGMVQGYRNPRSGVVYIYSDSSTPFDVQAVILNKKRNKAAFRMPLQASPEGASQYWCSAADYQQEATDIVTESFARYLNGYVGLNSMVDEANGRYCVVVDFTTWDNTEGSNDDGTYILALEVTGRDGQRVDFYGDGSMCNFSSFSLDGLSDGMTDGTINDIATGHNPIIVGSFNLRDDWTSMDKAVYGYNGAFKGNQMSAFTSYGTLIDGRTLPDICAPGATVISSSNEYYLKAYAPDEATYTASTQATYNDGKRRHSWHQCLGTSMAAPVVAGTMALWLEAYPQLSYAEAKQILRETATVDDDVTGSGLAQQWGAGKINAYEGLKKVLALREAGVGNVNADADSRLMVTPMGAGRYEVLATGADSVALTVYSVGGAAMLKAASAGNSVEIDCSQLPHGVYIINVNNNLNHKISL